MFSRDLRDSYLYAAHMRIAMRRRVVKSKHELHERMAEYWCQHARDLGRPGYWEHDGFQIRGYPHRFRCGGEQAYGPFSRSHWRYVWKAMRDAFLAEWHRALGTTYETTEGGTRSMAVLTGITS